MITCIDCGKEVERKSNRQKRCPCCAKEVRRDRDRKYRSRADVQRAIRERRARNRSLERKAWKAYQAENAEFLRASSARWKSENSQWVREYNRRWRQENPDLVRNNERRLNERIAAVDATRGKHPWTAAEDAVVMSWAGGLLELGAALGRTRNSVSSRRLKLRKRAAEHAANSKEVKP